MAFRTSNPALHAGTFENLQPAAPATAMTVQGAVTKSLLLLALLGGAAAMTWRLSWRAGPAVLPWLWGGLIAGAILALITIFVKKAAPITSPMYAVAEGLVLGAISAFYEAAYPGIAVQAVGATMAVCLAMLAAYKLRLLRVGTRFRAGVVAATAGVALLYLGALVAGLFGARMAFLYDASPLSIGLSVVICIIAALNLALDFAFIEEGAAAGAPKYMEWYAAFGLMLTLVWLYLEILRLLSKMRRR